MKVYILDHMFSCETDYYPFDNRVVFLNREDAERTAIYLVRTGQADETSIEEYEVLEKAEVEE